MNSVTQEVPLPSSPDGFHTYSKEWDSTGITYFLDGKEYLKFDLDDANRWGRKIFSENHFTSFLTSPLVVNGQGKLTTVYFPQVLKWITLDTTS